MRAEVAPAYLGSWGSAAQAKHINRCGRRWTTATRYSLVLDLSREAVLGHFLSLGCRGFLEALSALSVAVEAAVLVQSRLLRRQNRRSGQAVALAGQWLV